MVRLINYICVQLFSTCETLTFQIEKLVLCLNIAHFKGQADNRFFFVSKAFLQNYFCLLSLCLLLLLSVRLIQLVKNQTHTFLSFFLSFSHLSYTLFLSHSFFLSIYYHYNHCSLIVKSNEMYYELLL